MSVLWRVGLVVGWVRDNIKSPSSKTLCKIQTARDHGWVYVHLKRRDYLAGKKNCMAWTSRALSTNPRLSTSKTRMLHIKRGETMQYEHRNAISTSPTWSLNISDKTTWPVSADGNNNDSGVHPLSFSAKKSVCTRIDRIKHTIYVEKRVCFIRIV